MDGSSAAALGLLGPARAMVHKKKKPPSEASPSPSTPSTPSTPRQPGIVSLQVADDVVAPAACIVLHWEVLRQLGACLGDALAVSSTSGVDMILSAWASARVAPGRAGLADEVKAALGVVDGVRTSVRAHLRRGAGGSAPCETRLLELSAMDAAQTEAHEALGLSHGPRLSWLGSQMLGWPVCAGCVIAMRLHGKPLQLRVVRALPTEGIEHPAVPPAPATPAIADEAAGDETPVLVAPVFRVGVSTRLVIVPPPLLQPPPNPLAEAPPSPAATESTTSSSALAPPSAPPADVAGMLEVMERVREAIELPLRRRDLFSSFGVAAPTGVLLHGPPGTGKTLLARALCASLGVHVAELSTSRLLSSIHGDAEAALSKAFTEARRRAPSVLFLDEVDALGAARDGLEGAGGSSGGAQHTRLLAQLLTEMDGVISRPEAVLVLGATNRPEALDPALRRPGRFDTEIEVGVPSEPGRRDILAGLFARTPHELTHDQIDETAACSAGFVGADLAALHRHAALSALGRADGGAGGGAGGGADGGADAGSGAGAPTDAAAAEAQRIEWADVQAALRSVRPSALREVELRIPTVSWDDIGGQTVLKRALHEAVQWPLRHPEAFARLGIRPPRGVLLYGPPGCSKTLAAKALAAEGRTNFLAVKGPELFSKWVGESERAVAALFRRARAAAPSIIFFDEIDALAAKRASGAEGSGGVGARVLAQLLHEMDGVTPLTAVLVVAATNRPDLVDSALLRPGRFDSLIHVTLPDEAGRLQVLTIHTKTMPLAADVDLSALAARTQGYSGAELAALTREAALGALEEAVDATVRIIVAQRHLEAALASVTPRTTRETLDYFAQYELRQTHGKAAPKAAGGTPTDQAGAGGLPSSFNFTFGAVAAPSHM